MILKKVVFIEESTNAIFFDVYLEKITPSGWFNQENSVEIIQRCFLAKCPQYLIPYSVSYHRVSDGNSDFNLNQPIRNLAILEYEKQQKKGD